MTAHEVIELISTHGTEAFYLCDEWRTKREQILHDRHGECEECKKRGEVTTATIVHHIKHLKEFPELAFTDSNLEAVCAVCHNVLHPEKHKHFKSNKPIWDDEKW